MAKNDVKLVNKKYVNVIKMRECLGEKRNQYSEYESPDIEIWVDGKYCSYFNEKEKNPKRLINYLSKTARGL